MKGLQSIKDIVSLASRLQILCEGFDELNKNTVLTSKLKVLLELSKSEKVTPNKLSEKLGMAKSNLTILCNSLVKDKLVDKIKDEFDGRAIYFTMTKKGEELLEEILLKMKKNFEDELAYKDNIKQIDIAVKNLLELVDWKN